MIAWDTEWGEVDRNQYEAVLSDHAPFIVASLFLPLILRCFFSTLGGVITSVKLVVNTMYVLMGFIIELLSTISLNNGLYSESDEYNVVPVGDGCRGGTFWHQENGN